VSGRPELVRLLLVNLGRELSIDPAPEPLLALPPARAGKCVGPPRTRLAKLRTRGYDPLSCVDLSTLPGTVPSALQTALISTY
jgi:hypothetical protein